MPLACAPRRALTDPRQTVHALAYADRPSTAQPVNMTVRGAPGEPPLTVEGFRRDKEAAFKSLISGITGQPADWIDVSVTASQASPGNGTAAADGQDPAAPAAAPAPAPELGGARQDALLLASQVYAPEEQLPGVAASVEEAAANGTLARQLLSLGLVLEDGSGARYRSVHGPNCCGICC